MQRAIQNSEEETDMVGPQLLHEEIVKALEALKQGKAEGVDGILVEMVKVLGEKATEELGLVEKATEELVQICQQIYTSGEWSVDFMQSVLVPLPTKTNAQECSDHGTNSLIA